MKKLYHPGLLALAALLVLSACKKTSAVVGDHTQTIVLPVNGAEVVQANNRFAFNFLRATLVQDTASTNKLISPLSIYLALSMLYNGADQSTRDSIAAVLAISGLDINSLNSVCQSLITQFPKEDNEVQISIANSIWWRQDGQQPLASFLDVTKTDYDASAESLNFGDPASVNTINNWVAQKTNNMIPSVIKSISSGDLMFLINAIYFNGVWHNAFKPSDTHGDIFHLANGGQVTVPFMEQEVTVKMKADSPFTLIEIPYGGGGSYSMYIALPNDPQQPIGNFAALMNEQGLASAIGKMDSMTIELEIPKWEYGYSIDDMRPELSALGMGIAFGDQANFSKLYAPGMDPIYVSKAIHKTYIKVSEAGTQAAAATVVGITTTAFPVIHIFEMNRPFLYTIIEKQTGAVVFAGIVNDPSAH